LEEVRFRKGDRSPRLMLFRFGRCFGIVLLAAAAGEKEERRADSPISEVGAGAADDFVFEVPVKVEIEVDVGEEFALSVVIVAVDVLNSVGLLRTVSRLGDLGSIVCPFLAGAGVIGDCDCVRPGNGAGNR
jgi:hypothetical protein